MPDLSHSMAFSAVMGAVRNTCVGEEMMGQYRIEINIARNDSDPVWRYLAEDDWTACEFETEQEARDCVFQENRGNQIRIIKFNLNGIGKVLS